MFRRAVLVCLVSAAALYAATLRLYLKDGTYHLVREYQKLSDRVRYYSTERGDWEEIPLTLVDLKRTEDEIRAKTEAEKSETAAFDAEEKVEREQRREIERIPYDSGVYQAAGDTMKVLKQGEMKAVQNKRRRLLKILTPVPIVAGKQTIELDGPIAAYVVDSDRPEFYMRLAAEERFGIVRLRPTKESRIVQTWNVAPVTNEIFEEMEDVTVFKKQLADGLYKLWPTSPLAPGEYAVFEFTQGKGNIQVWDFSVPAVNRTAPAETGAKSGKARR
ncbi:MAG TPA: hypothetical protein VFL57_10745 [Bryobacteraceae bacterium]|nr:hypothetical protein [Bryobacteraceae bacterium]